MIKIADFLFTFFFCYGIITAEMLMVGGGFLKKHIPNIISAARIIAAIVLFFFEKITYPFVAIYIFCGLSDFVDGKLARKFEVTSVLGAYLDTIGDVLTYLALVKILVLQNLVPLWAIVWYIVAMIGNLIAAIIAKKRFGEFYFIHSLFGKILGVTLFILPLGMRIMQSITQNYSAVCMSVICVVATLSAFETIYIQLKSKEMLTDITSFKQLFSI